MPKTKISTVAKELNVALPTVIDFLRKKNINIDENPNTRVEEDVVALLVSEFKHDKDLKTKSDRFSTERQNSRGKSQQQQQQPARETDDTPLTTTVHKTRILGKIELDSKGNPVRKPADSKPAETTVKKEAATAGAETVRPEKKNAETDKKTEINNNNITTEEVKQTPAQKTAVKTAEVHITEKKVVSKSVEAAKIQPEVRKAVEPEKKEMTATNQKTVAKTETATAATTVEKTKDDVFVPERTHATPQLNVIGKIDLDAINQSTRPKKKSKEEKRADRNARNGSGDSGQGDRKKRKRISGKEKIDIEKTGQQAGNERGGSQRNGGQGNGNDRNRRDKNAAPKEKKNKNERRQPQHTEVSDEDVSKQIKETLARLTSKDKALKRGAKWRKEKREANASREREAMQAEMAESKILKLTEFVTVNDLAIMMDVPINNVIATCMNLGVMVSINQRLDAETINIVADEFGFETEYISAEVADAIHQEEDNEEDLVARPPIVTVMGHVDHGKTSLLDYIRHANVIAGEAGGITQHIGSYSVTLSDGRHITFLDTPGHEAFTAMRARGAKITDICIIIVAADDSVMPQTIEAINHASAAGVPIVFAINKIDKPHANPDKIKEELAAMNYLVEEWGGKYQSQDISAKKGIGVEELMEKVLLEAEMLELRANPNRKATGAIIESTLDKGRGYVANVLVQNGTLHVGDIVLAGNHYGKVKAMFNERDQRIKEAGPATPALILGLNGAPTAGDTFNVMDTEQEAREIANKRQQLQREQGLRTTKILTLEDIGRRRAIGNFQELNIIVKGDVDGSIEALSDSLIKLSTDEIQVNVLHKAVGEISESDVTLAAASDAVIIGFQVRPSLAARRAAEREGVEIRLYSVIYQAIEEVKDAMSGMLAPEMKEEITGTAEVLETFHISKVGTIAGAIVREGKIKRSNKVRLIRDGIVRYTGDLGSLKRFKDDVKEVTSGYDCGLSISGYNDIKVGDLVEGFEEVAINRSL